MQKAVCIYIRSVKTIFADCHGDPTHVRDATGTESKLMVRGMASPELDNVRLIAGVRFWGMNELTKLVCWRGCFSESNFSQ